MDPENIDVGVAMGESGATEDLNHAAGDSSSPGASPVDASEAVRSATYWKEIDQEEMQRERREQEKRGKITEEELPRTGSARKAKEIFESQPQEKEKETPVDLEILSGVTRASMKRYQENQASISPSGQRELEDLQEIQGGIAASHRDAFEKGKVSNVERDKDAEEEECFPTVGIASKTRANIESGAVIRAEDRYVRETDMADEMPTAGSASAVRRRFEGNTNDETKAHRRLSYEPEKGEAKGRLAMYMQSVEDSSQKNQSQDEEDARPPPGATRGVRQMFEHDKVIHAETNRQDSWKDELPQSGVAQASKEALKVAAARGYEKSQVEDEALTPGRASSTRSRFEKGEFENQKVIEKEEPVVSPGSAKEQMKHYQEAVESQGPRRRTMDNEQEDLQAARGIALAVKSSYEKEGAPHVETKRTIADEDFSSIQGRAKETTREIESGGLIKQAPKMVETEDFGVSQGLAKQTTQQIEKGELLKETRKMVEDEDFSGVSGLAKQTTQQIEKGELIKETRKMVEDEDFSGVSGVVKGTRDRIDSGEVVTEATASNSDKGDLIGTQSVSNTRSVSDQNGVEQ